MIPTGQNLVDLVDLMNVHPIAYYNIALGSTKQFYIFQHK